MVAPMREMEIGPGAEEAGGSGTGSPGRSRRILNEMGSLRSTCGFSTGTAPAVTRRSQRLVAPPANCHFTRKHRAPVNAVLVATTDSSGAVKRLPEEEAEITGGTKPYEAP